MIRDLLNSLQVFGIGSEEDELCVKRKATKAGADADVESRFRTQVELT